MNIFQDIKTAELPAAIHAVAVQDPDGAYTIFVNALCQEDVLQASIHELLQRIDGIHSSRGVTV